MRSAKAASVSIGVTCSALYLRALTARRSSSLRGCSKPDSASASREKTIQFLRVGDRRGIKLRRRVRGCPNHSSRPLDRGVQNTSEIGRGPAKQVREQRPFVGGEHIVVNPSSQYAVQQKLD